MGNGVTRLARSRFGGGAGIRTLGGSHLSGFQDQRFQPLSHPSGRVSFPALRGGFKFRIQHYAGTGAGIGSARLGAPKAPLRSARPRRARAP